MRLFATKHDLPLEHIRIGITHSRKGLDHKTASSNISSRRPARYPSFSGTDFAEISDYGPVQLTIWRGSEVQTVLLSDDPLHDMATTWCEHMRDVKEAVHQTLRN